MMTHTDIFTVEPGGALRGETTVPGDKSLSHRAVMFGALAQGTTHIRGWLPAGDTLATLGAIRALGVPVEQHDSTTLTVHGGSLREPAGPLDLVNAGTGIRLLAGILAGQPFSSVLDGSEQLRRRPMRRVTEPLRLMGAHIADTDGCAPLHICPAQLHGITYTLPVASAQVKSAILLAALFAQGPTTVIQPGPARDHTERMLRAMGANVQIAGDAVTLTPDGPLSPLDLTIPGDPSSAAFLAVAASLLPGSHVTVHNVDLNTTRTGLFDVLAAMNARVAVLPTGEAGGDPVGQVVVQSAALRGIDVGGETVVRMIDEFPILMVAALRATGETVVHDARELRVKETDRIAVMAGELRKMGAIIEEREDGFALRGPQLLHGAAVDAHDDHRIAMSLAVAGLIASGVTTVHGAGCAADSFPGFAENLQGLGVSIR